MEEAKKNIFERLLAISADLATVAKNLDVSVGKGGKYKAVGEADVLRAVKPLEAKHRVYSYPFSREIVESGMIESGIEGSTRKQMFERIRTVYRFVNIDAPEEFVDITTYGDGIDSGDKSVGKAMTYADKYALLKAYKIVTGADPDNDGSEPLHGSTVKNVLDPKLVQEAQEIEIDLQKAAAYLRKPVEALTNEELRACIDRKKQYLAREKSREAAPAAPKAPEETPAGKTEAETEAAK